jgi:hypothetical protein
MKVDMKAACKTAKEAADAAKQPYDREQAEAQIRLNYDACTAAVNALLQRERACVTALFCIPTPSSRKK